MKKLIFILVICVALVSCDSGPLISNYARVRQLYPNAKIYHEGDQSSNNQEYWVVIDSTGEYYRIITEPAMSGGAITIIIPIELK